MVSEQETSAIGNALVVLGAAGIVIPAFARFKISPVIGFILVGLLVGPSGLGALAADYPWLKHVTIGSTEDIALFGEFGIILSLPIWLQNVLGYTALQTGFVLLGLAVGSFAASMSWS